MSVLLSSASTEWFTSPAPLLLLLPVTAAYVYRWRAVGAPVGRLLLFLAGIFAAAMALLSPIDALGEELFTMHMVQHLLLLDIAPVLCLLGLTKAIFRPATRRVIAIERSMPWLLSPALGLGVYVVGMWMWHIPPLYDAAVRHSTVHVLEHVIFSTVGFVYWWHLISPVRDRRRLTGMGPVLYMAATKVLVGLLGIALTFAPVPLYESFQEGSRWGMTPLTDQAVGGTIMATEQSIVMGIALVWLVVSALDRSEKEQQRRERYAAPRTGKRELY